MQWQKMKRLPRYIPEEIIILILQRLPVKSLLRFRCVQKSWYHLIQSSPFVTAHSNHQKKNLLLGSIRCDNFSINSFSLSLRFDEVQCKEYYRIHQKCEENYDIHVHWYAAASHGLICYTNDELEYCGDIFLWNPAIRKVKKILPPRERDGILWTALAFGFCQKANDFKLVKISKTFEGNYANRLIEVVVYSLNTNSWKTIKDDNLICVDKLHEENWVFLNGTAYFRGSGLDDYDPIVFYDTDKDIMGEIFLPENWKNYFRGRSIGILNDSLVVFTGKPDGNCFNMWVLKQGSDTSKFCWEKTNVNLGGINRNWEVLGTRSNGEIVLREPSGNGLVSCDIEKNEEKEFADSWDQWFEPGRRVSLRIDSFSESLVLINT